MTARPTATASSLSPARSGTERRAPRRMTNRRMFATMLIGAMARRRSRALTAILSSAVGAATLFCLAAICLAVPAQVSAQIRQFGANLIVVPVSEEGEAHRVSDADERAITASAARASGTSEAALRTAAYRYEVVRINKSPHLAAGIDVDSVRALNGHWEIQGEWPTPGRALIGKDVADSAGLSLGSVLTVDYLSSDSLSLTGDAAPSAPVTPTARAGRAPSAHAQHPAHGSRAHRSSGGSKEWRVAGIVDTGGEEDDIIYATSADIDDLTGRPGPGYDVIEMSVSTDSTDIATIADSIQASADGVRAQPVARLTAGTARIITMLDTLFWVVCLIVLALTLMGVSTTMTVIVAERRDEIGLRKALGATGRAISMEFYSEAAILGLIGGALGMAAGHGLAQAVSTSVFDAPIPFSWWLASLCVALTALVAVVASIAPVRSASRIDPAVVLREE
ncbi:ABC transporter permease [Actinomyces timonensis]|uniref:ABC transporter permease n=1 Tax=Actinomyces timonensis TaxID=1288391 RepID=A0AAU8MXY8_9ACTO